MAGHGKLPLEKETTHETLHAGWLLGWLLPTALLRQGKQQRAVKATKPWNAMECHGMPWISCFTDIVHVILCVFYNIIIAHGWQLEPCFHEFASHFGLPRAKHEAPEKQLDQRAMKRAS